MESEIREAEMRTKIENSKGFYKKAKNSVSWIKVTGIPDRAAMEAGNNTAHRANVEVDALLIEMKLLDEKKYVPLFKKLYTIPLDLYQKLCQEGGEYKELLSLDRTLRSCFLSTPHSHPPSLDKRFAKSCEEAMGLHGTKDLCHASWKNGRPVCFVARRNNTRRFESFLIHPDIMRKIAS
jgi:hypothetical protein